MRSTTAKKTLKWIFQTKKGCITYSNSIIDEIGRCPTRSNNAYFANNEQELACSFVLHMSNIIKLKLYYSWSAQTVNDMSKYVMWNSSKPIKLAHLYN